MVEIYILMGILKIYTVDIITYRSILNNIGFHDTKSSRWDFEIVSQFRGLITFSDD